MSNLTEDEKDQLRVRLNRLVPAQFEEAVAQARMPRHLMSAPSAPQGTRSIELVNYVAQDANRAALERLQSYLNPRRDPDPPPPPAKATSDLAHIIATRLDRTKQWAEMNDICAGVHAQLTGRKHAVVVLHGPRYMDLHYFARRLEDYAHECTGAPLVVTIPLFREGVPLKTPADLEQGLQKELAEALGFASGTTETLIAEVTSTRPVVFVVGLMPLEELKGHRMALRGLLRERAPALVSSAERAVVFYFHSYSTVGLPALRSVARPPSGLAYIELPELTPLREEDIKRCLRDTQSVTQSVLSARVIGKAIRFYTDLLNKNSSIDVGELARRVADKIEELKGN